MSLRRKISIKTITSILFSIFLLTVLYNFKLGTICENKQGNEKFCSQIKYKFEKPTILWWNFENFNQERQCGIYKCEFTDDRNVLKDNNTKAILFYGSHMNTTDFPLPRSSSHIWALFHEESPKNLPYIQYSNVLKYFNYTSTFSRYSDFPLTTQYLKDYESLRSRKFLVPIGDKTVLRKKLAPVVYLQSICETMSERDAYIKELMNYIEIDSYGKCLNNKELPESLQNNYLDTIFSDELHKLLANYKFIIAYENGICNDYISEKFWRPLIVGSIPVYFGSPTIKDWMPNNKSAILISDFKSPKELAEFLLNLDENDYEYNTYLDHKYLQIDPIPNKLLMETLFDRNYEHDSILQSFECFMCEMIHENSRSNNIKTAKQADYNCGGKLIYPKMSTNLKSRIWNSIQKNGKCEADILNILLSKNEIFTIEDWYKQLDFHINNNICKL